MLKNFARQILYLINRFVAPFVAFGSVTVGHTLVKTVVNNGGERAVMGDSSMRGLLFR